MRFFTFCLLLSFLLFPLNCIEINHESSVSEDGVNIETIQYESESDGLISCVLYGTKPLINKIIRQYDSSNPEYIEHEEFINIDFTNPSYPDGKCRDGTIFYQTGNPEELLKQNIHVGDETISTEVFYIENNSKNITRETIVSSLANQLLSIEYEYSNASMAKDNIRVHKEIYNENKQKVEMDLVYFPNQKFIHSQVKLFQPGNELEIEQTPYKVITEYDTNDEGLVKTEYVFDNNEVLITNYYDSLINKTGLNCKIIVSKNNIVIRVESFYNSSLFPNKKAHQIYEYNESGNVVFSKTYDIDNNELN